MKITLSRWYTQKHYEFIDSSYHLTELFTIARDLKFDGIDYMATIPEVFFHSNRILGFSRKYNVPILGVHAPIHFLLYTPQFTYKKLISMISAFPDCNVFNFHLSGFINPLHKDDSYFRKFVEMTREFHIPISFESNPKELGLQYYPKVTWEPDLFAEYCIRNKLAITFDTSHVSHVGYDIVEFFKKYHKHLKLIHLSDCSSSSQHLPLGKGSLPIKDLLKEIKRHSYNQQITFEINNFSQNASREERIEDIRKSLEVVRKYTA